MTADPPLRPAVRRALPAGGALALALLLARPLAAQSLAVQAREEVTGAPLAGAIVDVLDATDRVVVRGILSADGRRTLPVGAAGASRFDGDEACGVIVVWTDTAG